MLDQKASQPGIFFTQASQPRQRCHKVWRFTLNFPESKVQPVRAVYRRQDDRVSLGFAMC